MHILDFLKQIDVLKVATLIAVSWDEISPRSLQLSWRKILPETTVEPEPSIGQENDTCVRECAFGFELHDTEIEEWLGTDNSDSGYAHLNDDEIISDVVERPVQEEAQECNDNSDSVIQTISHSSVIIMFDGCMQWMLEQGESNAHNMAVLKELRDLAAKKRISTIKQKKIRNILLVILEVNKYSPLRTLSTELYSTFLFQSVLHVILTEKMKFRYKVYE